MGCAGKYESVLPFEFGGYAEALDACIELLRPPVPTILLAELRGALMLSGRDMFRAGLYVGLGSLGKDDASCVFKGSFGGCCGRGMSRGPEGREDDWYSEGDGILTDVSESERIELVSTGAADPLSLANLSAKSFVGIGALIGADCWWSARPCKDCGFG